MSDTGYDTAKFTDREIDDELSNRPPRHRSDAYLAALRSERDDRAHTVVKAGYDAEDYPDLPVVTIRESTADERRVKFPPIVPNGPRVRVPKYVVVTAERDNVVTVFGLPQGGDTRAEAVFWAERAASKNDLHFERPDGWERVDGVLPG